MSTSNLCRDVILTSQPLLFISSASSLANLEQLYAFRYKPTDEAGAKSDGWDVYDAQSEYLRMAVPNPQWCLSKINDNYEVRSLRTATVLTRYLSHKRDIFERSTTESYLWLPFHWQYGGLRVQSV